MVNEIFNERLNLLADIFRKTKRNPKITITEHGGIHGLIVDTPRKFKGMYHGSGYEIGCDKQITKCNIGGDLATRRVLEDITKEQLEKLDCEVFDIHRHPEDVLYQLKEPLEKEKESHLHFRCPDKDFTNTVKIVQFIKNY